MHRGAVYRYSQWVYVSSPFVSNVAFVSLPKTSLIDGAGYDWCRIEQIKKLQQTLVFCHLLKEEKKQGSTS